MNKFWLLKIRNIWRPGKGLPGTRDKMPQIRNFPYCTGRVATLHTTEKLYMATKFTPFTLIAAVFSPHGHLELVLGQTIPWLSNVERAAITGAKSTLKSEFTNRVRGAVEMGMCDARVMYCLCLAHRVSFSTRASMPSLQPQPISKRHIPVF